MIQISNLDFSYREGAFRLHVGDLVVEQGATVAVIGPSGSGKTTLLNLVAGIMLPHAGKVVTDGIEITGLGEAARRDFRIRRIGLVFQEFELLEHLNVLDNILLPYRINPAARLDKAVRHRAGTIAAELGMGDKLRRFVRRLSQGERQRVAVCRALLHEPPLLLCDEPTGNLDPKTKDQVMDLLFDYVKRHGTTLLAVTHDHEVLHRFGEVIDFKAFQAGGIDG